MRGVPWAGLEGMGWEEGISTVDQSHQRKSVTKLIYINIICRYSLAGRSRKKVKSKSVLVVVFVGSSLVIFRALVIPLLP